MLTPFDDYPIHQTPEPVAQPHSGDRNVYDRYFFNGYTADGSLYFAAAWGLYPNRAVQDAAFSVVRGGEQVNVHASRRAPLDRVDMTVGPIAVEVVEPLRRLRVTVGPNEAGIEADLTFSATTAPMQEPRFTRHSGPRVVMDYTRLTQFGAWDGWVVIDGERIEVSGSEVAGSRDRSWGIRGVGERDAGAPGTDEPQFFWLWAPITFDGTCVHFDVQEDADGRRWHWNGELAPTAERPGVPAPATERAVAVDWEIDWKPGTRRAQRAAVILQLLDGTSHRIDLEPMLDFQMLGIGYFHPQFSHGSWLGDEAVLADRWRLDDLDPMAIQHLHVQALCTARWGDRVGTGILEQLVIGRHLPSGFTELLDPAR
ncbi:MAG TPA: hypothetical protein VM262_19645 [Acidimicrobiales bacterium]|nr:hypothetical protein [Acidimicrobiales bacterium]